MPRVLSRVATVEHHYSAHSMSFRYALQEYIDTPSHPRVLHSDDQFVIIQDAYPKSLRHYLVIPRDRDITFIHPLVALREPEFYSQVKKAAELARELMIQDLVDEGYVDDEPERRAEFAKFIKMGVHSVPSMANLHVHVITQDFYSSRMKNKKHYLSFTTSFFVELKTFESERESGRELHKNKSNPNGAEFSGSDSGSGPNYETSDSDSGSDFEPAETGLMVARCPKRKPPVRDAPLKCTHCGVICGSFPKLKAHLAQEFIQMFRRA